MVTFHRWRWWRQGRGGNERGAPADGRYSVSGKGWGMASDNRLQVLPAEFLSGGHCQSQEVGHPLRVASNDPVERHYVFNIMNVLLFVLLGFFLSKDN